MKLNMWMIANRLKNYEIEAKLNDQADAELNSVLPIYMTGCVRVSAKGKNVICEYDGEYILIKDISLNDGYMLIQSIFDWYQEWMNRLDAAVFRRNFEKIAEECSNAMDNPVMIQDSDYQLLGMYTGEADRIEEWEYIKKNGQSSIEGYQLMASMLRYSKKVYRQNVKGFSGKKGSRVPVGGLHATISFQGYNFGKMTVLEQSRKINKGDICLLEYIARRISIYMAAIAGQKRRNINTNILEALIKGKEVQQDKINYYQMLKKEGETGSFAVMVLDCGSEDATERRKQFALMENILVHQFPKADCQQIQNVLVILFHNDQPDVFAGQIMDLLYNQKRIRQIWAGLSLKFCNLSELRWFYEQAVYAAEQAEEGNVGLFYSYAVPFLLNHSGKERICACEPDVRKLQEREYEKKDLMKTLLVYLDEERSSQHAAERLYIHKNTLTYRIKYLKEQMKWNLDDSYVRNYLKLSAVCLSNKL